MTNSRVFKDREGESQPRWKLKALHCDNPQYKTIACGDRDHHGQHTIPLQSRRTRAIVDIDVMTMSFLTPLPPLFPRLSYQIPILDTDQDPSYSIIPSIPPSQNQNQRNRRNSQDNKYISDIDREEEALQARVVSLIHN
jgi:hypothetical protein